MKKTLLIALAGIMLFSFTQCNNKDDNKKDKEKEKETKSNSKGDYDDEDEYEDEDETREYKDFLKAAKEAESILKRAKDCDDLERAEDAFMDSDWAQRTDSEFYEFEETMTRAEREMMEERMDKIADMYEELMDDFDCYGGYGYDDDDDDYDYGYGYGDSTSYGSGSDFRSTKKAIEETMKAMRNARTCDDLDNALFALIFMDPDFDNMTSYEQDEIDRLAEELGKIYENRSTSLGCQDDDDSWDDDDDDWGDW